MVVIIKGVFSILELGILIRKEKIGERPNKPFWVIYVQI